MFGWDDIVETVSDAGSFVAETAGDAYDGAAEVATDVYDGGCAVSDAASGYIERGEEAVTGGVHFVEDYVDEGSHALAAEVADVPVLGTLAEGAADAATLYTEFSGGVVGGATTLLGGIGNAIANPIDTAKGLNEMVSHVPGNPIGMVNRIGEGIYDYATGERDGLDALDHALNPITALREDADYWKNVGGALIKPYQESIEEGRYGEVAGRGAFDIAMLLSGAGEAEAAAETAETTNVARAIGEEQELTRALGDAAHGNPLEAAGAVNEVAEIHVKEFFDDCSVEWTEKEAPLAPERPGWEPHPDDLDLSREGEAIRDQAMDALGRTKSGAADVEAAQGRTRFRDTIPNEPATTEGLANVTDGTIDVRAGGREQGALTAAHEVQHVKDASASLASERRAFGRELAEADAQIDYAAEYGEAYPPRRTVDVVGGREVESWTGEAENWQKSAHVVEGEMTELRNQNPGMPEEEARRLAVERVDADRPGAVNQYVRDHYAAPGLLGTLKNWLSFL